MWNKIRYVILFAALCCFTMVSYGQGTNGPPEPKTQEKRHQQGPCGQGNGNPGGGGNGRVPPPVGLCLPINDYLMPLLIAGILFGGYKIRRIETLTKG